MDAVRLFEIHFSEVGEREGFFEGQEAEGVVNLELMEDVVIDILEIEFTGIAKIELTKEHTKGKSKHRHKCRKKKTDDTKVVKTCDEKYLNQKLTLYSRSNCDSLNFMVPAGQHAYRFRVQLPYNLPSSVVADRGSIRYYATATLTRPWHPKESTSKEFRVRTLVDLNNLSQSVRPVTRELQAEQSVLCCVVGSIEATWHLERVAFVPGESVTIQGHIDNRSKVKVKKSKASLVQHIRYFDLADARYLHERRVLGSAERGEVAPGTSSSWCEAIRIPELVPPGGLRGCTLMEINYVLKMKVVPAGPLHNLETSADIIIGSVGRGEMLPNHDASSASGQKRYDADMDSDTGVEMNYFV